LGLVREPEEFCKRIILASYNKSGTGNFSAAVFVERNKSIRDWKGKSIGRISIYAGI